MDVRNAKNQWLRFNMSRYCKQGYIVSYDFVSQLLRLEWNSRIAEDHCHLVDGSIKNQHRVFKNQYSFTNNNLTILNSIDIFLHTQSGMTYFLSTELNRIAIQKEMCIYSMLAC